MAAEIHGAAARVAGEAVASMRPRRMAAEIVLFAGEKIVGAPASMRPRRMAAEIARSPRVTFAARGLQ